MQQTLGLSRKAILSEVEHSLRRLGTDYIDLYQVHRLPHERMASPRCRPRRCYPMRMPTSLEAALTRVDQVFEPHYRKPQQLCMYCDFSAAGLARSPDMQRFFEIVRAHRAHRLTMPIEAIWSTSLGHTLGIFHDDVRRLAWFVPAVLAATLRPMLRDRALAILLQAGQETTYGGAPAARRGDPSWFSEAELTALDDYLVALMPRLSPESCEIVLGIGFYFESDQRRLADAWLALDPYALAEAVLAFSSPSILDTEPVRAALEHVVLSSTDAALAARCSEAEAAIAARTARTC